MVLVYEEILNVCCICEYKNTSKITFIVNTYAYVLSSTAFCNVYFKHTKRQFYTYAYTYIIKHVT